MGENFIGCRVSVSKARLDCKFYSAIVIVSVAVTVAVYLSQFEDVGVIIWLSVFNVEILFISFRPIDFVGFANMEPIDSNVKEAGNLSADRAWEQNESSPIRHIACMNLPGGL
ncbi:hypothetical protein DI09_7p460 [Mitosporidium daphniae]|uniref:Uncharacterized protein n=1 Tax=Mitosporidium daphniae TaxID=1485682 RepID=A0A098VMF6_9MICR|nr:uncharacterized protein DI09_7p460 [Mitosporidium daphniae]KGG50267.1 hypothetical protein DI09_7p460 [Mitosporidium daphniae]|eukprot:XP_013236694.1 uncharacterized protein DI09_7p460 [Mitosporidium daphniae]